MEPVGLDLSLTSTGIAYRDVNDTVSTKLRGAERLHVVSSRIMTMIAGLDDSFVVVEGYSFASRNSQAHAIGELGGCVRMRLWEAGVPFVEVPPTVRAKFATGRGNAGKTEVLSALSARTGIVWSGAGADDRADAWVLQEIGLFHLGRPRFDWPKAHQDALTKIDWTSLTRPV